MGRGDAAGHPSRFDIGGGVPYSSTLRSARIQRSHRGRYGAGNFG